MEGGIMLEILNSITMGISGFSGTALNYVGALAIAGTIAMAILQIIKELTPLRRWYQRHWLECWFKDRAEKFKQRYNADAPPYYQFSADVPQSELVELATGGETNAFYDLDLEQLVAQMNAAAQIALEYPQLYFTLLAVLSQGAEIDDVRKVQKSSEKGTEKGTDKQSDRDVLDARNRVGHRIQRNLDGIQIALGSRWKFYMQAVSIILTILFVEIAIFLNVKENTGGALIAGILLGTVGGYLAPVTRDIVAALQNLRKG
jgi:hypothetical protein